VCDYTQSPLILYTTLAGSDALGWQEGTMKQQPIQYVLHTLPGFDVIVREELKQLPSGLPSKNT
jgi:hypothetical protein